jgi:hypothetical protein
MWFIEPGNSDVQNVAPNIGRIGTSGTLSEYPLSEAVDPAIPSATLTAGPDGAVWFTEPTANKIGRITVPASTTSLFAAVLPSSRSVEIGTPATAFATIINASATDATGCAIAPVTTVPAVFQYRPTDPATNQVIGTLNTPVSIPAGGSQSFVFGLMPNAPVVPTLMQLGFDCTGFDAATSTAGLNTLLYSASSSPVPDIVALAATVDPGYVDIPGATGTGEFAVATINLGADAAITAAANTGTANLPVTLSLCQTNPTTGACMASPTPIVTTDIQPNATPTFGIFVTGSGSVANSPGVNRVFVTFTDSGGVLRGETSVAVRTQ